MDVGTRRARCLLHLGWVRGVPITRHDQADHESIHLRTNGTPFVAPFVRSVVALRELPLLGSSQDCSDSKCYPCCWTTVLPMFPAVHPDYRGAASCAPRES